MKILLAEDELPAIESAGLLMELWQYELEVVPDGKAAVERVKERPYDLVLMDLVMPVMDGYEAIGRIRNLSLTWYQPILALSATGAAGECLRAGADDFLEKPYDCAVLQRKILELTPKVICLRKGEDRLILEERMPLDQSELLRLKELWRQGLELVQWLGTGATLAIPRTIEPASNGHAAAEILSRLQQARKTLPELHTH